MSPQKQIEALQRKSDALEALLMALARQVDELREEMALLKEKR